MTRIIGERFYRLRGRQVAGAAIEAGGESVVARPGDAGRGRWVCDPAAMDDGTSERPAAVSAWIVPTFDMQDVIVGSAVIEKVDQRDDGMWQWHLADIKRAKRLRNPPGIRSRCVLRRSLNSKNLQ